MNITLNRPQIEFINLPHKFRAFVAGFGSGKTWVGCSALAKHFYEHPRVTAGYFAPTYPQIRDIFYPTMQEVGELWGFKVKVNQANKEAHFYQNNKFYGTVICRSLERPETIIGFKIGKALVDEIDVMPPVKAAVAWRKIIARLRHNDAPNGIDVTTTPEGFRFVHNQFHEQLIAKPEKRAYYGMIQASTYDNELNLPDDYIPSLLASYPEQLIDAYINGNFVNLRTGSVYAAYNRFLNHCTDTIQDGEALRIGLDFNVGKMSAIIHVVRDGLPRAVDEITGGYDTPDIIRRIKERYFLYADGEYKANRQISIYPDASGDSRKSVNASETDLALLRAAGFRVVANRSNPPVKDRVNSMNAMFCNSLGERRYLVNYDKCPTYASCLEQQPWTDQGEPDKSTGHDHCNDAAGYFIQSDFAINARKTKTTNGW